VSDLERVLVEAWPLLKAELEHRASERARLIDLRDKKAQAMEREATRLHRRSRSLIEEADKLEPGSLSANRNYTLAGDAINRARVIEAEIEALMAKAIP
jgi:hypothetical protein